MNNSTTSQPKEESLIKVAKETFFKKNGEAPQSKTVENVANCTLANVFARKREEKKEEIKRDTELARHMSDCLGRRHEPSFRRLALHVARRFFGDLDTVVLR